MQSVQYNTRRSLTLYCQPEKCIIKCISG